MKISFKNFGKFNAKNWIFSGLIYGALLLVIINVFMPLFSGDDVFISKILHALPLYAIAGLGYGYIMKITFFND